MLAACSYLLFFCNLCKVNVVLETRTFKYWIITSNKDMQKKNFITAACALAAVTFFWSAKPGDSVISKEGKTTIVNTTTLTKKVRGYKGNTPVRITIQGNKVVKVEALPNQETPKHFARAKKTLSAYEGKTVSKAQKVKPDIVTGATFSSKALAKNVEEGLKYYKEHK